ncbi:MAG TPA: PilN domain-containing protein [Solirubrobacterales bacterium]|jgi:Tfp pilus assembly protein PilN|nr:PilN domain-containing protein [Solirubrobacterales bacterium]
MRPVNLIPPESRRGQNAPLRSGPLPYIAIGALVAVLLGVTALVLVGNQISDHKADLTRLEAEDEVATARAEKLAGFTQFRTMREQRLATVASLADSRFDWQRVMQELALILPHDVWLTELIATASAESGNSGGGLRGEIPGPALEIKGCGVGHESVAAFVTDLKDIDGVTRVAVESSEVAPPASPAGAGDASGGGSAEGSCQTRSFLAQFEITIAFDAAPVPPASDAETLPTATEQAEGGADEAAEEGKEESSEESSEEG